MSDDEYKKELGKYFMDAGMRMYELVRFAKAVVPENSSFKKTWEAIAGRYSEFADYSEKVIYQVRDDSLMVVYVKLAIQEMKIEKKRFNCYVDGYYLPQEYLNR